MTPRQIRAAEALAEGATGAEAARLAGVDKSRVSRWRRDPVFRAHLRELGHDVVDDVRGAVRAHANLAVAALVQVLRDAKAPHAARVTAATALLHRVLPTGDGELAAVSQSGVSPDELRRRLERAFGSAPADPSPSPDDRDVEAPVDDPPSSPDPSSSHRSVGGPGGNGAAGAPVIAPPADEDAPQAADCDDPDPSAVEEPEAPSGPRRPPPPPASRLGAGEAWSWEPHAGPAGGRWARVVDPFARDQAMAREILGEGVGW